MGGHGIPAMPAANLGLTLLLPNHDLGRGPARFWPCQIDTGRKEVYTIHTKVQFQQPASGSVEQFGDGLT
jgi:hypothetical protein